MPSVVVTLDGVPFTLRLAHGDYIRAEHDGATDQDLSKPTRYGVALVTFHALQRLKRKGEIDGDVPSSYEDYLDAYAPSSEDPEDEDPDEGKDSGQDQPTG